MTSYREPAQPLADHLPQADDGLLSPGLVPLVETLIAADDAGSFEELRHARGSPATLRAGPRPSGSVPEAMDADRRLRRRGVRGIGVTSGIWRVACCSGVVTGLPIAARTC